MKEEMDSLRKNKTSELVDHLAGQKPVSCKWKFKIKEWIEGVQKPRYKARLVARGFTQRADDMLIACKSKAEIGSTKSLLEKEFDMKELGEAKTILGMEIVRVRSRKILRVSQSRYAYKILNNFRIDDGKSVQLPLDGHFKLSLKDFPAKDCDVERMSKVPNANTVGSLMYLMVCTRPDIGIVAEYLALTVAMKEAIWLMGLLEELGVELNTIAVNCCNHGAIHLSRNHVFHERAKHINVRYHFIREVLKGKSVKVLKVGIEHNVADALTKVLPGRKLQQCLELMSVGVG
ncbi:retrotransposon protein, putative, ty1-copia subclass [Tanacetum coccineum]